MRWLVVAVLLAGAAACGDSDGSGSGSDPAGGVRIGSFDFAESELLAEIYAGALEGRDVPVVRVGTIGPREIVAPALRQDLLDLVPEYVGTAARYYGADTQDFDGLEAALEPVGLVALDPAGAEDVNVVVVTETTARQYDLVEISDLVDLAPTARFGGPVECPDRPLCLPGLRDTYGLTFEQFVPYGSLELTAEALRRGEIDVGLMFSTSAALSSGPFVALDDDKGLQPSENVVPVLRRSALERWGEAVPATLADVSAVLTTEALRSMNERVDGGDPAADVAAAWLAEALGTAG